MFDSAVAAYVCEHLAEGKSLREICRERRETDPTFPAESTVRSWVVDDINGFAAQYARARDIGLDCLADEIREISDTPVIGETETTKEWGTEVKKGDMLEHRRLQVDSRKWYLSKLAPKRYGDRIAHEHSGEMTINGLAGRMRKRSGGSVEDLV
jgi:hypothetical protein